MERYIFIAAVIGILYLVAFKVRGRVGKEYISLAEHIVGRYRRKK